jgi:AcrR family transcriptional regulator
MDAALELFGTRGYAVVPVDRICRTAGISTKSFYPLFDNKEALFTELYDELVSALAAKVIEAPVDGYSIADSVGIRLGALVHAVVDDPRVARVVLIESAGLSPAVEERRRAVHSALATFVVETTGKFVAAGELPDRDYRRASLGLVGAINELIIDFVHSGATARARRSSSSSVISSTSSWRCGAGSSSTPSRRDRPDHRSRPGDTSTHLPRDTRLRRAQRLPLHDGRGRHRGRLVATDCLQSLPRRQGRADRSHDHL